MLNWDSQYLISLFEEILLFYCILVVGSYLVQGVISTYLINRYRDEKSLKQETTLLNSKYLPSISLIAPAYNESVVIVENIHSLLSLQYFNLELIIVNDGSKDDSLEKVIKEFDLYLDDQSYEQVIDTEEVIATYKSHKKYLKNLIVVDKKNGGKADAVNAGINHTTGEYVAIIDVDCLIDQDAFLKLVQPILDAKDEVVVAVGGSIGHTNDSIIKSGKLIKARTPKNFLPRIQVIEYMRAFFMSRPMWSKMNGLLLISGALGIFDRDALMAVKGYTHGSLGEDMDLVMKLHQHCLDEKIKYKIAYVPETLCWTEVPEDPIVLKRQRIRWMKGTIECMIRYRKMCLNPKYGVVGMISYPYWFLSEMLAPIAEFLGLIFMIIMVSLGLLNYGHAFILLLTIFLLSISLSFFAICLFYLNFGKFRRRKDLLALFKTAILEPFKYHPKVLSWSLLGYYQYFVTKENVWGEMTRVGFKTED